MKEGGEVESIRFLKSDGKTGVLSVVVDGVLHVWKCRRQKMLTLMATCFEDLAAQEDK